VSAVAPDRVETNQRELVARIEELRARIERAAASDGAAPGAAAGMAPATKPDLPRPDALQALVSAFSLTPFEEDVVLLAAGRELSSGFARTLATVNGGSSGPSFSLALAALRDPHWSALLPDAPLRAFRIVELAGEGAITEREIRIDEAVLHWLAGVPAEDERLAACLVPLAGRTPAAPLTPGQQAVVAETAEALAGLGPLVELVGDDASARRAVALAVAAALGREAFALPAAAVPALAHERSEFGARWQREARLRGRLLLIESDAPEAAVFAARIAGDGVPILLGHTGARPSEADGVPAFAVPSPTPAEAHALWRAALSPHAEWSDDELGRLACSFRLGAAEIGAIAGSLGDATGEAARGLLAAACRDASRRALGEFGGLARRIVPCAGWEDLVLAARHKRQLRAIADQALHRWRVHERWGFARRSGRGLGISALFTGASGTGKTMAAEVLAGELGLELYQVDLSAVVSKYIGETEKNLRRVFDAAEGSGAVLFFDEADALFGKRSEVKDSHDRYANVEVSYLLQRMEQYEGIAILATNLRSALDQAFMRRLRFVVEFPFPDAAERREIWRRVLPLELPQDGVDVDRLARLNLPGGNIRNIALSAAFLAAAENGAVTMRHLRAAAEAECAKLERPLADAEVAGW
jgi:hypothetical protein